MFALGIVPAAPGLKFVHQHKAKTYQVLARIRCTSDIRSKTTFSSAPSPATVSWWICFRRFYCVCSSVSSRQLSFRKSQNQHCYVFWAGHFQQAGFQSVEGSIVATAVVGVVNVLMTGFQFR